MSKLFNPLRWIVPRIVTGHASWCGRYMIIYAPINISLVMERGTQGLEWFRYLERKRG